MSAELTSNWIEQAAGQVLRTDNVFPTYHFFNGSVEVMYDDSEHAYFRFDQNGETIQIPSVTTILHAAIDKSPALMAWSVKLCTEYLKENLVNPDGSFKSLSTEEFHSMLETAKGQHKVKLNEAGDIGTMAHNVLEMIAKKAIAETGGYVRRAEFLPELPNGYVQGSDLTLELKTSMARSCVMAGLEWIRRHNTRFLFAERKIYSRAFDFAGTCDGVAYVDSCDDITCCRGEHFKQRLCVLDYKSANEIRESFAWQLSAYQLALVEELGLEISHRYVLRLGKSDGRFEPWMISPKFFELDLQTFLNALNLYRSLEEIKARRSEDKKQLREIIKQQKEAAKQAKEAEERAAKEERKLAKQAERDAKKAIREEEKAERRAAKAKPGPVLVPSHAEVIHETATGLHEAGLIDDQTKKGFDEDFWAGGFGIDAGGKQVEIAPVKSNIVNLNADTVNNIEPKPAVVPEIQAVAEDRAVKRFWSLGTTFTTGGWLQ